MIHYYIKDDHLAKEQMVDVVIFYWDDDDDWEHSKEVCTIPWDAPKRWEVAQLILKALRERGEWI